MIEPQLKHRFSVRFTPTSLSVYKNTDLLTQSVTACHYTKSQIIVSFRVSPGIHSILSLINKKTKIELRMFGINNNETINEMLTFKNCEIIDFGSHFDYTSGEPATLTVTFSYEEVKC